MTRDEVVAELEIAGFNVTALSVTVIARDGGRAAVWVEPGRAAGSWTARARVAVVEPARPLNDGGATDLVTTAEGDSSVLFGRWCRFVADVSRTLATMEPYTLKDVEQMRARAQPERGP